MVKENFLDRLPGEADPFSAALRPIVLSSLASARARSSSGSSSRSLSELPAMIDAVERYAAQYCREKSLEAHESYLHTAVFSTPVRTGLARANWQSFSGEPPTKAPLVGVDPTGALAIASGRSVRSKYYDSGSTVIAVANYVDYIGILDARIGMSGNAFSAATSVARQPLPSRVDRKIKREAGLR